MLYNYSYIYYGNSSAFITGRIFKCYWLLRCGATRKSSLMLSPPKDSVTSLVLAPNQDRGKTLIQLFVSELEIILHERLFWWAKFFLNIQVKCFTCNCDMSCGYLTHSAFITHSRLHQSIVAIVIRCQAHYKHRPGKIFWDDLLGNEAPSLTWQDKRKSINPLSLLRCPLVKVSISQVRKFHSHKLVTWKMDINISKNKVFTATAHDLYTLFQNWTLKFLKLQHTICTR